MTVNTQTIIDRINADLADLMANADLWRKIYLNLCSRYDDALTRINNLQAENEAMKAELARRQ